MIRPLDDRTDCARSAFTHLGVLAKDGRLLIDLQSFGLNLKGNFRPLGLGVRGYVGVCDRPVRQDAHDGFQFPISSPLTDIFYIVQFLS